MDQEPNAARRKGIALIAAGLVVVALLTYGVLAGDMATAWLIGVPVIALGVAIDRTPADVVSRRLTAATRVVHRRRKH